MPLLSVAGVAVRKNLRRSRVEDDASEALNMSFSSRRSSRRRSCISRSRRVLRSASASPASSVLRAPGESEFTSLDATGRAIPEWAESEGEGAPGGLRRRSSATSTFPSLSAGKPTPLGDIVRLAISCSIIRLKSQSGGPACRAGVARRERSGKNGLRVSSPAADRAALRGRAKSGAISIRSPESSCAPCREARVEPASERARRAYTREAPPISETERRGSQLGDLKSSSLCSRRKSPPLLWARNSRRPAAPRGVQPRPCFNLQAWTRWTRTLVMSRSRYQTPARLAVAFALAAEMLRIRSELGLPASCSG
jgi:hypothetical protein